LSDSVHFVSQDKKDYPQMTQMNADKKEIRENLR